MNEIISQIKKVLENQGISETQAAKLAEVKQNTVNRMLAGKTKKPDIEVIKRLQVALGIVSEKQEVYAVTGIHQQTTPAENEMLQYFRQLDKTQQETMKQMMQGMVLLRRER